MSFVKKKVKILYYVEERYTSFQYVSFNIIDSSIILKQSVVFYSDLMDKNT